MVTGQEWKRSGPYKYEAQLPSSLSSICLTSVPLMSGLVLIRPLLQKKKFPTVTASSDYPQLFWVS